MTQPQKKRLMRMLLWVGAGILGVVAYGIFYRLAGFGLPCYWERVTGFQCAGCGMTRATAALLQLDFEGAFSYNAVWPLYFGYGLWAVTAAVVPYVKNGTPVNFPRPYWVSYVVLGLILVYGVVRNFV